MEVGDQEGTVRRARSDYVASFPFWGLGGREEGEACCWRPDPDGPPPFHGQAGRGQGNEWYE